jgi:hypothetical protein
LTPRPTALALLGALAVTAIGLSAFALGPQSDPRPYLALFALLFALRVAGQLVVLARRPEWLPPFREWNLVPYRILLPVQFTLISLMAALAAGRLQPGPDTARWLVAASLAYALAMVVRYVVRMTRRPSQRWFGGAIPIAFHLVLAAALLVLGWANLG